MGRRPPKITLTDTRFPDPTLFRSVKEDGDAEAGVLARPFLRGVHIGDAGRDRAAGDDPRADRAAGVGGPRDLADAVRERRRRLYGIEGERSEERRGGTGCGRTCRSRWWPEH